MSHTQFITLLVKRVLEDDNSYEFIHNEFNAQGIVVLRWVTTYLNSSLWLWFRDSNGKRGSFETVSIIEYDGKLHSAGTSFGHYLCDVKDPYTKSWYRTNDNSKPRLLEEDDVSKQGYILLLKKITADSGRE